ncbi:MAG: trans-sulfuration enzyme family protein [bacterium]
MARDFKHFDTRVIHSGEPEPRIDGAVSMPIFQSAMFEYAGETSYHDLKYIRLNNTPNHKVLNQKLAALENAEAALVTASGMAAISAALLTVLAPGGHLLAQNTLYGGTHDFTTQDFPLLGLSFDFIDGDAPETWGDKLRPNTRAIYVESMTNPLLQVADLESVVQFARNYNIISMIDNTFPSPYNFQAVDFGFDISLHSCTKYLNGHSDIVGGAAIGRQELIDKVTHKLNHLGGSMDPHACFLLQRGIKTLAVRMRQHNASAQKIAEFLEQHSKISQVNYPGLTSHKEHERARELFSGFSGMLSFELEGGLAAADTFIERTTLPIIAPSLGSVESLLTRPAITSHAGMSRQDREKAGITDGLIRMSVGIEATEEIIEDLENALRF